MSHACAPSVLGEMQNTMNTTLKAIQTLDKKFTKLDSEMRAFRRGNDQKLDRLTQKTDHKLEIVQRRLGSVHETLCRSSLKRNMYFLAGECRELEAFSSKETRIPCRFTSAWKVADYLKFRPKELSKLEEFLKQSSKGIGVPFLRRFVTMVQAQLVKLFTKDQKVWPAYAIQCDELVLKVEKLLGWESMPVMEIMHNLTMLKEIGTTHGVQIVKDLTEDVQTVFYLCFGPKHNVKDAAILNHSWGLMLLFWTAFGVLRHGELELDVKGQAERKSANWQITFGEIKSSEGKAVEKGKRQLKFAAEVFDYVCKIVWPNCGVHAVKVLFVVNHEQHQPSPSAVTSDMDVVTVFINQLPD